MQISNNIIRFPTAAPVADRREEAKTEAGNVVEFPSADRAPIFDVDSQERGQVFAAHRIVSRIADQLDSFSTL
jgi:hypothetical protein